MHAASFLIQLVVLLVIARGLAWLLRHLGQPAVVAEMTAGFLLGPVALGAVSPAAMDWLVSAKGGLDTMGQIGLTLFMFVVGAELRTPRANGGGLPAATAMVAAMAVAIPALLALALAPWVYAYAPAGGGFWPFTAFFCLAIATTAVPVMARVLQERGDIGSREGSISLSAAAFGDVLVWLGLPLIIGFAKAQMDLKATLASMGALLALAAVAFWGVRPLLQAWWRRLPEDAPLATVIGMPLVIALIFAAATSAIGLHAVFGAFLAGLCQPRDIRLLHKLEAAIAPVSTLVLLPCFFASAGFQTIPLASGGLGLLLAAILVVAVVGKLVGGALGARLAGCDWPTAGRVGVLMNIRGMMELVVIKIGFDTGLIGADLFTTLFLMAIVTTAMATPMLGTMALLERLPLLTRSAEKSS